jgi:hypothetical protein
MARSGEARPGVVWLGEAQQGKAWGNPQLGWMITRRRGRLTITKLRSMLHRRGEELMDNKVVTMKVELHFVRGDGTGGVTMSALLENKIQKQSKLLKEFRDMLKAKELVGRTGLLKELDKAISGDFTPTDKELENMRLVRQMMEMDGVEYVEGGSMGEEEAAALIERFDKEAKDPN